MHFWLKLLTPKIHTIAPIVAGALIGGGASLIGGFFNSRSQSSANQSNAALQREFAQNQIQWRVKDAQAAGISPLAALGASTTSAAPSYVGANPAAGVTRAGSRIGQAIASQGQAAANIDNTKASTDLIHQQILASKQAMALEAANRTQDGQDVDIIAPRAQEAGALTSPTGTKFETSRSSPAEEYENRYGEIVSELAGLNNLVQDGVLNLPPGLWDKIVDVKIKADHAFKKGPASRAPSGYSARATEGPTRAEKEKAFKAYLQLKKLMAQARKYDTRVTGFRKNPYKTRQYRGY